MPRLTSSRLVHLLVPPLVGAVSLIGPLRAEEITLKDGQKITGSVVGFENGMFRVETEFGFALVRKDKVKSISFGVGESRNPERKAEDRPLPKVAAPQAASTPAGVPAAASPAAKPPAPVVTAPPKPAAPPPPPPSHPVDEPLPAQIRDRVDGTTYLNETFQFSFYKPPGWRIHENAARETGRAIVAMGPEDERTLLFVDRQVWSGLPNLKSDSTDANLRSTYQDYRLLSESALQVDGHPALRREFSGVLDGAEWRGVSVHVAQGNRVFGLVGLTSAETLQFHQALLNKIITSFHFLPAGQEPPFHR